MTKIFVLLVVIISTTAVSQTTSEKSAKQIYLPSALIDGRFYLKIATIQGDTIVGFCDTGGGYTAIYNSTIKKLGLQSKVAVVEIDGTKIKYIPAKEIFINQDIPYPQMANYFKPHMETPFFEAPDDNMETNLFSKFVRYDVFLGQFFFMNHAWTFDYTSGKIFINTPLSKEVPDENIQALGFKKDMLGNKKFGHPSMKFEIDGKIIDFLFDTGATFLLSDSGRIKLGVDTKSAAGSFIAKSLFDNWRLQHPDWRVIEKGEITGADLIEVPQVKVGNLTAGPVWFAKRPDEAWSRGMIGSMDKVVKGAMGGSFLQYFKITIDYNSELIRFDIKKY